MKKKTQKLILHRMNALVSVALYGRWLRYSIWPYVFNLFEMVWVYVGILGFSCKSFFFSFKILCYVMTII